LLEVCTPDIRISRISARYIRRIINEYQEKIRGLNVRRAHRFWIVQESLIVFEPFKKVSSVLKSKLNDLIPTVLLLGDFGTWTFVI